VGGPHVGALPPAGDPHCQECFGGFCALLGVRVVLGGAHWVFLALAIAARAVLAVKSPSPSAARRWASKIGKHCSSAASKSGAAAMSAALAFISSGEGRSVQLATNPQLMLPMSRPGAGNTTQGPSVCCACVDIFMLCLSISQNPPGRCWAVCPAVSRSASSAPGSRRVRCWGLPRTRRRSCCPRWPPTHHQWYRSRCRAPLAAR